MLSSFFVFYILQLLVGGDLIFSRYYLGHFDHECDDPESDNCCRNRFIEVFNPTNQRIDLGDYEITFDDNPAILNDDSHAYYTFGFSHMLGDDYLEPGESWLIVDEKYYDVGSVKINQQDKLFTKLSNATCVGLLHLGDSEDQLTDILGNADGPSPAGWIQERPFLIRKGWRQDGEKTFTAADWYIFNASDICSEGKNDIAHAFNPREISPRPTQAPSTLQPSISPTTSSKNNSRIADNWFYACLVLLGIVIATCAILCWMSCCFRSKDEYGFVSASHIERRTWNQDVAGYNVAHADGEHVYRSARSSGLGETPKEQLLSSSHRQEGERKMSGPTGYSVVNQGHVGESVMSGKDERFDNRISRDVRIPSEHMPHKMIGKKFSLN